LVLKNIVTLKSRLGVITMHDLYIAEIYRPGVDPGLSLCH